MIRLGLFSLLGRLYIFIGDRIILFLLFSFILELSPLLSIVLALVFVRSPSLELVYLGFLLFFLIFLEHLVWAPEALLKFW